jgi:hypothetical protein
MLGWIDSVKPQLVKPTEHGCEFRHAMAVEEVEVEALLYLKVDAALGRVKL